MVIFKVGADQLDANNKISANSSIIITDVYDWPFNILAPMVYV